MKIWPLAGSSALRRFLTTITIAFIAAYPARVLAQSNLENDPAYLAIDKAFDFKAIKPEVNINLPKFLLKDALADLDGGKNDPLAGSGINISELIQDIKLIRVVVMERNKSKSDSVAKGVAALKATLEKTWTPIAVVAENKESVGIYAISDAKGESTAGLAVLVHETDGDTVIANIVGRVSLGKIVKAASQMNKFPKDLLKKLSSAVEPGDEDKPKEKPEKPAN
jgi:hypothetical protein